MVTTPEIAEVLTRRNYFNTFGGNPVCTAAGLAVMKVIEKEKLQENAFVVGSYLKERLTALKDKYEGRLACSLNSRTYVMSNLMSSLELIPCSDRGREGTRTNARS